jgi:hypothetical protein
MPMISKKFRVIDSQNPFFTNWRMFEAPESFYYVSRRPISSSNLIWPSFRLSYEINGAFFIFKYELVYCSGKGTTGDHENKKNNSKKLHKAPLSFLLWFLGYKEHYLMIA